MVSVRVSWSGKTDVFFTDPQKTKVDQNYYIDPLKTFSLIQCCRLYPNNEKTFNAMQDSDRR